ncbi:hypothetical protein Tco_0963677 [Tanacetum coccineum]
MDRRQLAKFSYLDSIIVLDDEYPGLSHVALAGLDPDPMHDDFVATVYPQNLDAYTFGDQFFIDKPTEEESDKANMETKVESIVTVPIHQASSSVPPLSTPVIDLSPPKPVPSTTQTSIFTATTSTTPITLPLPTPPQQQSTTNSELAAKLPEADMKEILHQRMFETGTYKSLPEHVALYEALEAYMERANRDEFFAEKDKSRKRRRDDQDPPPPPPDSDLSKKKRHDSDASG